VHFDSCFKMLQEDALVSPFFLTFIFLRCYFDMLNLGFNIIALSVPQLRSKLISVF
jgi:hypothetical protein